MKLSEARRDQYRKLAKKEGFVSRAAFKLVQLHRKYKLFSRGDVVVDLGCAPGGWLQIASSIVGPEGFVLGVDLVEPKVSGRNILTIVDDVRSERLSGRILQLIPRKVNVILSDLSPKISGVWEIDQLKQADLTERVLQLAPLLLVKGGSAVLKVFDGPMFRDTLGCAKSIFDTVRPAKPTASRGASSELYLVCKGFRSR